MKDNLKSGAFKIEILERLNVRSCKENRKRRLKEERNWQKEKRKWAEYDRFLEEYCYFDAANF